MNILFLYTELAGYFLSCVNKLAEDERYKVHIVRWPVNKEAPFDFTFGPKLKVYDKNAYSFEQLRSLVDEINPAFIYCSGWIDKDYLKIAKSYKSKIPVVVGFDNHWTGSLKQRIATMVAPFTIRTIFNHCWIPGKPQELYAKKMGFDDEHILRGFYSADVDHFNDIYNKRLDIITSAFPRRFIYSGRYVSHKWITELTELFDEARRETNSNWELWCLGTGPVKPLKKPGVKHLGFVQPSEMQKILEETSVFILPSLFEPWGVVVHEFAAAGFPLICSDAVGAASAFLKNNENGFIYKSGDRHQLKHILKKVMKMSEQELLKFGKKSHLLAQAISPAKWAGQVKQLTSGK